MLEPRVRAMEPGDVARVVEIAAAAFEMNLEDPRDAEWFHARAQHLLISDREGAFVAERDGRILGVAQAMVRDRLWCLSILAVDPEEQGGGAGRALMKRALAYGEPWQSGLIVASNDSRAMRLYARAGFSLLPTLEATGPVDRSALPPPDERVTAASADELEDLEQISRDVRGGSYTPELELVLAHGGRLLRLAERGFAVAHPRQGLWLLVARDEEAATALLWSVLAASDDGQRPAIRWLTGGQDWAVDVALRAGLSLRAYGALCVRGQPGALRPFVPSGPFA